MVNIEQVQRGIKEYIDFEIGNKATGIKKFFVYFILPSVDKYTIKYLDKLKNFIPEIIDDSNNIDIDMLYNYSKSAIQKTGQFEFMNIIFNETDIDKLYTYINKGGI